MRHIEVSRFGISDRICDFPIEDINIYNLDFKSKLISNYRANGFSFSVRGDDRYPLDVLYNLYFDETRISLFSILEKSKHLLIDDVIKKLSKLSREDSLNRILN